MKKGLQTNVAEERWMTDAEVETTASLLARWWIKDFEKEFPDGEKESPQKGRGDGNV